MFNFCFPIPFPIGSDPAFRKAFQFCIGQKTFLAITKNITKAFKLWKIVQSYLALCIFCQEQESSILSSKKFERIFSMLAILYQFFQLTDYKLTQTKIVPI